MKLFRKHSLVLIPLLFVSFLVRAQNPNPDETTNTGIRFVSQYSIYLSIGVLTFGLIIVLFEFLLIRQRLIDSSSSIKILIVSLIITGTLFLIVAGYTPDQISPALGLLGTIAGYILGKSESNSNTNPGVNPKSLAPEPTSPYLPQGEQPEGPSSNTNNQNIGKTI